MKSKAHWTATDQAAAKALMKLKNIGPATADDLLRLGVRNVEDLAKQDHQELYRRISEMDGVLHDPCVLDVFQAIIVCARGGPARDWWHYSAERKASRSS